MSPNSGLLRKKGRVEQSLNHNHDFLVKTPEHPTAYRIYIHNSVELSHLFESG